MLYGEKKKGFGAVKGSRSDAGNKVRQGRGDTFPTLFVCLFVCDQTRTKVNAHITLCNNEHHKKMPDNSNLPNH